MVKVLQVICETAVSQMWVFFRQSIHKSGTTPVHLFNGIKKGTERSDTKEGDLSVEVLDISILRGLPDWMWNSSIWHS